MFFKKWRFLRAIKKGNIKKVTFLLEAGVDPNLQDKENGTALHLASLEGYLEVVRLLIEKGADIETQVSYGSIRWRGMTVLHLASLKGHLEVVRLLIEKGADIEAQDKEGQRALHFAIAFCKLGRAFRNCETFAGKRSKNQY